MDERKRKVLTWAAGALGVVALVALGLWGYRYWFVPPTQAQIDAAVNSGNWRRVARLIERSDLESDGGRNYYSLGVAYQHLNEPDKAIAAFMKADDKTHLGGQSRYQIAFLYAKSGETRLAMQWLKDSLDAGFENLQQLQTDPAFEKLRSTEEWEAILQSLSDAEVRSPEALDFLLGTWNLTQGGFGASTITYQRQIEGRVVSEDWTQTSPGASGVFVFDPAAKQWEYSYVDGYGRTFSGPVRIGRQLTVISGTLRAMDGLETARRIEIRNSSGAIDYTVLDSRNGGRTWDTPTTWRLSAATESEHPAF